MAALILCSCRGLEQTVRAPTDDRVAQSDSTAAAVHAECCAGAAPVAAEPQLARRPSASARQSLADSPGGGAYTDSHRQSGRARGAYDACRLRRGWPVRVCTGDGARRQPHHR